MLILLGSTWTRSFKNCKVLEENEPLMELVDCLWGAFIIIVDSAIIFKTLCSLVLTGHIRSNLVIVSKFLVGVGTVLRLSRDFLKTNLCPFYLYPLLTDLSLSDCGLTCLLDFIFMLLPIGTSFERWFCYRPLDFSCRGPFIGLWDQAQLYPDVSAYYSPISYAVHRIILSTSSCFAANCIVFGFRSCIWNKVSPLLRCWLAGWVALGSKRYLIFSMGLILHWKLIFSKRKSLLPEPWRDTTSWTKKKIYDVSFNFH